MTGVAPARISPYVSKTYSAADYDTFPYTNSSNCGIRTHTVVILSDLSPAVGLSCHACISFVRAKPVLKTSAPPARIERALSG